MDGAVPDWVVIVAEGAAILILALVLYLHSRRTEK